MQITGLYATANTEEGLEEVFSNHVSLEYLTRDSVHLLELFVSSGFCALAISRSIEHLVYHVCLQVNGGSQSFNVVNILRVLGRWMRMIVIPNQSSVPKAWTEFDSEGRMKESGLRDRVVDVAEEFYKVTLLTREHAAFLVDRYSERKEKREKGRLLSQAEKEAAKAKLAVPTSAQ